MYIRYTTMYEICTSIGVCSVSHCPLYDLNTSWLNRVDLLVQGLKEREYQDLTSSSISLNVIKLVVDKI